MEKTIDTITNWLKSIGKKIYHNEYVRVFVIIFALGFFLVFNGAITNQFTLPIGGDYALQSYAFYVDGYHKMWEFFKTGQFPMYDYGNILGTNYIGSASFYYLFSPFFYMLLLCPAKYIYQGIYFMLVFKYALGGLFFYILLKRCFKLKKYTALIGGFVYAYSGWTLFYLWFHFSDVVTIFPLLLLGIELLLRKKKGWLLTLSLFLMGITNYFFLFTFAICGVGYALFRWIQIYGINIKKGFSAGERWGILLKGMLYFGAGILLSGAVLFPSYIIVLESGRAESKIMTDFLSFFFKNPTNENGLVLGKMKSFGQIFSSKNLTGLFKYMFVWNKNYNYNGYAMPYYILSEFLFMNYRCLDNAVFNNGLDNAMGGMFITTPLALLLVPSLFYSIKSKKAVNIVGCVIGLLLPFLPFTFYLLHGFTNLYGRWELFMVAIALIYLLHTFDKIEEVDNRLLALSCLASLFVSGMVLKYSLENGTLSTYYFENKKLIFDDRALLYIGQLCYMVVASFVLILYKKKQWFKDLAFMAIVLEVVISSTVTIYHHGFENFNEIYGGQKKLNEERKAIEFIQKDEDFYRIFNSMATRAYSNLPATLSYRGVSTFNSIYNKNLDDFIARGSITYGGSWSMGYHEKRAYFDQFLGIKYYIVDKEDLNNDGLKDKNYPHYTGRINMADPQQEYLVNVPFGYSLYQSYPTFDIYINDNFINLGFAYDYYILSSMAGSWRDFNGSLRTSGHPSSVYTAYYDTLYSQMAIIEDADLENIKNNFPSGIKKENHSVSPLLTKVNGSSFNKYISLREDCTDYSCNNFGDTDLIDGKRSRNLHQVTTQYSLRTLLKETYKSDFVHSRWHDYGFFGDQLIFSKNQGAEVCANATASNPCYVEVNFKMGPNALVSLFNGDKMLTQDAHQYHNYSMGNNYQEIKNFRGFYVSEPVTKVMVEFLGDYKLDDFDIDNYSINYGYYNTYIEAYEKFRENPLIDVKVKTNSYEFKSNFANPKLLVLNVPFDNGWTMKINDKDATIYKANGGFIGVIAPQGAAIYKLSYYTPGLKTGILVSFAGLMMAAFVAMFYNRKTLLALLKYSYDTTKDGMTNKPSAGEDPNDQNQNMALKNKINYNLPWPEKKVRLMLEIVRYIIVGGIATIIDMVLLILLKGIFPSQPGYLYLATAIGFLGGLATSYILSVLFVFLDNKEAAKKNQKRVISLFVITSLIGLAITQLGMLIGVSLLGLYYIFVKIFVVFVVLVWNYVSKKIYVFKDEKK